MFWHPILSARKKREIRQKIAELPARSVVLFVDETDLLLFPPLRAAWARRGEPAKVPITGGNAKRVVWGVFNVLTGYRLFRSTGTHLATDFCEFLELIRDRFRSWHVALVLDNDSRHTAGASRDAADDLLYLYELSPHEALRKAGVQSGNFWLFQ